MFLCVLFIFAIPAFAFSFNGVYKFAAKKINGSTPKAAAEKFLYQWQRNDWKSLYEQTAPSWRKDGGSAYKLSLWFENYKDIEKYSIEEVYSDGKKNICVAEIYINSKRFRLKFNIKEENYTDYVDVEDLRRYIDLIERTDLNADFSPGELAGVTYCYADGISRIYHYSNNCSAAGDNLIRMPESEALYRNLGPCGRCAR